MRYWGTATTGGPAGITVTVSGGSAWLATTNHGVVALSPTGSLWGLMGSSYFGGGTLMTPKPIPGGTDVASVVAINYHLCLVTKSGALKCWGDNGYGELGDSCFGCSKSSPSLVADLPKMKKACAGTNHSCGIDTSGAAWCWGRNYAGQLGDGSTVNRATPAKVHALTQEAVDMTCGDATTCVLTKLGAVVCWGRNDFGQVGDGSAWSLTPESPKGLP